MIRRALAALALIAALAVSASGGPPAEAEGAVAPANAWLMDGGCPARTGRTATRLVAGPVEAAWEQNWKGCEIEGEPLVVDAWVFVCVREAAARTLYVIDLAKGAVVTKKTFKTALPLIPCLGPNLVVLRTAPNSVSAYRWRSPELTKVWSVDEADGVESIVAVGREIYVRHGGSIARFELGRRVPTWERASMFRGRLAVRGDRVYALDYPSGGATLVALSRTKGEQVDQQTTGSNIGGVPKPGADIRISVGARHVFVLHEDPINTNRGGANTSQFPSANGALQKARVHDCVGETTECDKGWIGIVKDQDGVSLILDEDAKDTARLLADSEKRPEFGKKPLAATFARGTTLLAGAAVDLDSGRVLWRSGRDPVGRLVPARGAVLVAEAGGRLVALREARGGPAPARIVATPTAAFAGKAAMRDGSVVAGTFTLDAAAQTVVLDGKPPRTIALADALLVEDNAGALVVAGPDAEDVARGVETLLDKERTDAWRDLAKMVASSRDEALLRHVVTEAWVHGCSSADLADAEGHLRDLSQPGKVGKEDPALTAKVAEAEARLAKRSSESALAHAKALPASTPPSVLIDFLRVVLALDPTNADAVARVRAVLPANVASAQGFSAADWLDFADAVLACPVTIMPQPAADAPDLTQIQRTYGSLLYTWRRDLVAFQSEHLVLITPIARPGAIARCLSMGELVCASLEKFFEGQPKKRKSAEPLVIRLVDSVKLLEELTKVGRRPGDAADFTWGQYTPSDELSTVFLPDEDEGFRAAMPVFAYILTQQWMEQRCPAFTLSECRHAGARPHFWLESGFPKLVGEMRWDLRRRTWRRDRDSETPGFLAHVPAGGALAWPRLAGMNGRDFWELDPKPKIDMVVPDRLGWHQGVNEMMLFEFQASALAQYLFFADDGKLRGKFLEFLGGYYRGEPIDFAKTFGIDVAAAGDAATKYAAGGR